MSNYIYKSNEQTIYIKNMSNLNKPGLKIMIFFNILTKMNNFY